MFCHNRPKPALRARNRLLDAVPEKFVGSDQALVLGRKFAALDRVAKQ